MVERIKKIIKIPFKCRQICLSTYYIQVFLSVMYSNLGSNSARNTLRCLVSTRARTITSIVKKDWRVFFLVNNKYSKQNDCAKAQERKIKIKRKLAEQRTVGPKVGPTRQRQFITWLNQKKWKKFPCLPKIITCW